MTPATFLPLQLAPLPLRLHSYHANLLPYCSSRPLPLQSQCNYPKHSTQMLRQNFS